MYALLSVLWTPTGYMLSVSLNGNINILNSNSPDAPERTIQAHQASITALHFDRTTSKADEMLAIGDDGRQVSMYRINSRFESD